MNLGLAIKIQKPNSTTVAPRGISSWRAGRNHSVLGMSWRFQAGSNGQRPDHAQCQRLVRFPPESPSRGNRERPSGRYATACKQGVAHPETIGSAISMTSVLAMRHRPPGGRIENSTRGEIFPKQSLMTKSRQAAISPVWSPPESTPVRTGEVEVREMPVVACIPKNRRPGLHSSHRAGRGKEMSACRQRRLSDGSRLRSPLPGLRWAQMPARTLRPLRRVDGLDCRR